MLKEALPTTQDLRADDPDRICPMLAGPSMIDGDTLIVRQAQGEIAVQADRALLRKAFRLCDGTRSLTELLAGIARPDARDQFGRFLRFLLDSGAFVDASGYLLANMGFAWGNNPYGQAAPDDLSERIGYRFSQTAPDAAGALVQPVIAADGAATLEFSVARNPDDGLQSAMDARVSTYVFGGAPLTQDQLDQLVWSLAGIVGETRARAGGLAPRRTTPSAGSMHLAEVYVALRQPTSGGAGPGLAAGIYRVQYPGEYRVRYTLVSAALALLPRAVAKPWCLESAAGMVFLAADAGLAALRYRNRAVQYLYTEAGMALQNGALTASRQGMGFVAFGSYYEAVVRSLCGTPDHLILGSAIFGGLPSPAQLARADEAPAVDFAWAEAPSAEYTLPFHVGRAKLKHGPSDRPTWGRDTDPALAFRKALAETIERQGYREPRGLRQAAYADLEDALDPREVARFSAAQYRGQDFACVPFDAHAPYWWAEAERLTDGRRIAVLADLVYSADALRDACGQTRYYWRSNSSGCAAGTTMADARLAGTLELIERDAFMRHWFAQQPGTGLRPDSLPGPFQDRLRAIASTGFTVSVQTLASRWAQVIFLFARHAERRFACVSAGAGLSIGRAMESALVELESRVFSLLNGHDVGRMSPARVRTPDDHFALYARPAWFNRADRLFTPLAELSYAEAGRRDLASPQALYEGLVDGGIAPLFVDITPRKNAIGGGDRLAVARAFAPGLIPMAFGAGMEPRGSTSVRHPASAFPHPFP